MLSGFGASKLQPLHKSAQGHLPLRGRSHQFTAGSLLLWEQAAFFKMSNQQSFNIGRHRTVILLRRQFDSALRLVRHSYGYRRCFCHEFTCVQLTFNFIVFRLNSLALKCNGLRGRL